MTGDILATKIFIRRQPGRRIAVGFLLISFAVHRQSIQVVISERPAHFRGQILRALLPGVRQRHHMINLHRTRRRAAALKNDRPAGVRIMQLAARHGAAVVTQLDFMQITRQNFLPRVAIFPRRPTVAKLFPRVTGFRGATLNRQFLHRVTRQRPIGILRRRRDGRRRFGFAGFRRRKLAQPSNPTSDQKPDNRQRQTAATAKFVPAHDDYFITKNGAGKNRRAASNAFSPGAESVTMVE